MKSDIHPTYYKDAKVSCACGNKFTVGSTRPEIKVEICSACHPFYTGKGKLIDTAGRAERFKARAAKKKAPIIKKSRVRKTK
jgi:large subunit ribosomal protein L31